MRILIFHGYLLAGTGSNIYNARLARALVGLGHEVHLLCQDRHPERQPFVDAAGDWEQGELRVRTLREPVRCTAYRPEIGGLLPVYVEDPYEGIEARAFARCGEAEIERYIDANVAAVRELVGRVQPDLALANHLVMGPAILARALARDVPYAVKVHGSALEYTVKPDRERFLPYAREGVEPAEAILVGSLHTARSLWDALEDPAIEARTRLGPPGVDVELFKPLPRRAASRPVEPVVAFVGKLIVNKGVDLLIAAWPLVLERVPRARLEIVGFGGDREWLERLLDTLAAGELERRARSGARRASARVPERPRRRPKPGDTLASPLSASASATSRRHARCLSGCASPGASSTSELAELLPACEALVVPSTFPEAFGMVAAEGAACGALPVSAAHSGLAEVSGVLANAVPAAAAGWLSFPVDDHAVPAIAQCLVGWLRADPVLREQNPHGPGGDGARALVVGGRGARGDRGRERRAGYASLAVRRSWPGRRRPWPWPWPSRRRPWPSRSRRRPWPSRRRHSLGRRHLPRRRPPAGACRNTPPAHLDSVPVAVRELGKYGTLLIAGGLVLLAVAGCGSIKHGEEANLVLGKQQFVAKCGACHMLARASTKGTVGPDLDEAFRHGVDEGLGRNTIRCVVQYQVEYPNPENVMPKGLADGSTLKDISAYVAYAAARPGSDTGLLASAVAAPGSGKPAVEKAGKLELEANPAGQLAYTTSKATATAGPLTISMKNVSGVIHNVALQSGSSGPVLGATPLQSKGTASVAVTLKPGTYTYFCQAPGHRAAGMVGTIAVK